MDPKKKQEEIDKELERQEAERARLEEDNKKAIEEERRKAQEAREAAARAEGMVEALKSTQNTQQKPPEWTEEQWTAWEEKTGMKREGLAALDNVMGAKIAEINRSVEERVKQAEDRAKKTEDRYAELEKSKNYDRTKSEYFAKKPQFSRYEKEIDEFLSDYPDTIKNDKEKMGKLLEKAEVYIKGKVGEKNMRNTPNGSARFGSNDDEGDNGEEMPTDFSDLRSHERATMEKIVPDREKLDRLNKYRHDLKGDGGVMISAKEEFDKYNKK